MRINPKNTIPNIKIDSHPPTAECAKSNVFCLVKSDVIDGISSKTRVAKRTPVNVSPSNKSGGNQNTDVLNFYFLLIICIPFCLQENLTIGSLFERPKGAKRSSCPVSTDCFVVPILFYILGTPRKDAVAITTTLNPQNYNNSPCQL